MTKTAQHSILFRLWIHLRGVLAIIIVLFGIIVGLVSLILPNEALYKHYVVGFLSKQWNKQVSIDNISGKWQGFGPKFIIKGLSIKDQDEVIVQQATLDINVIKYLIPKGSTGITLGINDISVDFERKDSGKIVFKEPKQNTESFSNKLGKLLATGNLSVNNFTFNLHDTKSNKNNKISSSIQVQQNNNQRAFELKFDSKEFAKKIIIKGIADKSDDFMQQAKWYVEADDLSLNKLGKVINKSYLPKAFVDAQMWFSTEESNIVSLLAKAKLKKSLFNNEAQITGQAQLVYQGNKSNWKAELSIKDIQTASISQELIQIHLSRHNGIITLEADVLDIELLKSLLQILNISNEQLDKQKLVGKISDVSIKYDIELRRIISANIHFHQLDFKASFGEINKLSGELSLKDDQIRVLIDSDSGSATLPLFIRGTINWNKLLITAQTSMQDDDLDIKINSLWCDCQDFILDGAIRINYDKDLTLDITVAVYDAVVNQLYKYWPSFKWKPKVLNFLDQALVFGKVDKGMIIYHGMPKDFPFSGNQGMFLTKSNLINGTIKYDKNWPAVNDFNAIVYTKNRKLTVKSTKGKVLKAKINQVTATINNLKKPKLLVEVLAHGKDNFLIELLKKSPIRNGLNVLNQGIILVGKQNIKVNLDIPLYIPNVKIKPTGKIIFIDTDFQIGQFQLFDLRGVIDFQDFSLFLEDIKARFLNQEVVVSGSIINHPQQESSIDVLINGDYNIQKFAPIIGMPIPAKGISPWLFSISNKESAEIYFTAQSDLSGVELDMPAPFKKTTEQITPFLITCALPCVEDGWDLNYDNKFRTNFNLSSTSDDVKFNTLVFGNNQNSGYGGNIEILDVDEWINVFAENQSHNHADYIPFQKMSLHVNELLFMSRTLKNVDIEIIKEEDGLVFEVSAQDILGSIKIANDIDNKGIIVNLEKLYWQKLDTEPVIQNISKVSQSYPALHVWIEDFIYDGIPLGEASIEVRPVNEGVKVEKFSTYSDLMSLNINGIWLRDEGEKGLSKFNIIMTSKDIAKFLLNLGFQAPISKAETIIDMQAQWSDFPSQFEIKNINGSMRIEVGKGEVVDAKPGMGRILGLFSLTNLPRRLILDFRDVLGKGLEFQSMRGDFVLKNGVATTKSFVIDSSSAKIIVSGETGLAKQDYDQIVTVVPRVGRVLPTIGAITGGAVGAAAGFFVQGMFHKGLKDVGKIVYKVTGSWDNPTIELLDAEEKQHEE